MPCVFLCNSNIESYSVRALLGRKFAGLEAVDVGHWGCLGCKRLCLPSEGLRDQYAEAKNQALSSPGRPPYCGPPGTGGP